VIEVDEHLRDRIRAALVKSGAYTVSDPVQLGRDAAALIQGGPIRDVPAEVVEAAVRLLPAAEAAAMWAKLEDKIVAESAWPWAETVTIRAGAVEVQRVGPETILATQAATRIHAGITEGLADLWRQVADTARRYPVLGGAFRFEARAVLGLAALGENPSSHAEETSIQVLSAAARQANLGSLVAALDGPIGRGDRPPDVLVRAAEEAVESAAYRVSRAGLMLSLATLALQDGRLHDASQLADEALATATGTDEITGVP
jgi:hypothetical protein